MAAGGFKMSLGGLKAKPGLKGVGARSSSAQNATKPKKALLGDDEPDDSNQAQEIAAFDAAQGGAIDINGPTEKKGPLVIPSLPNRNWREEARKRQLEKAPHVKQQGGEDVVMEEPEKEVVYGLTVPMKPSSGEGSMGGTVEAMDVDVQAGEIEGLTDAQRLEKAALEHLLTGSSTDTQRVVPAITDEEALANDLHAAPDEPDLDAYEATPIEGFGLAMLRGMGWKDSDGESRAAGNGAKAPKDVKRRPALLGIGAKPDAAKDVELGEFNSKARPKKGQGQKDAPAGYNPVTLRNKKTGEVISEEELKRKLESQDIVQDEKSTERRRDYDSHSDRKTSRRDDRDRDGDHSSSRRDRDKDRADSRRKDRYDDDSDGRRSKRRDRDRDRRERSRSPRDDKRRDRYRSRSRDSKDRRSRRDRSRSRSRSREDEDRRRRRKARDYDDERDERRRRDREERSSRR
ncbi:DNA primase large subunit Spp2 [Didymella sp. IMI 355093]|nr:DNA primase large subunit Spp2 [Didymella sp. IMI 355093]